MVESEGGGQHCPITDEGVHPLVSHVGRRVVSIAHLLLTMQLLWSGVDHLRFARNPHRNDAKCREHFLQADFWPASKSAIKCRIRSAVTQAEAAIAIATSLHG